MEREPSSAQKESLAWLRTSLEEGWSNSHDFCRKAHPVIDQSSQVTDDKTDLQALALTRWEFLDTIYARGTGVLTT